MTENDCQSTVIIDITYVRARQRDDELTSRTYNANLRFHIAMFRYVTFVARRIFIVTYIDKKIHSNNNTYADQKGSNFHN